MSGERAGFSKAAWQAAVLVILAAAVALSVNAARPSSGIALFGGPPKAVKAAPDFAGLDVMLDEAAALQLTGAAVFLDARSETAYKAGHIAGARRLSPGEAARRAAEALSGVPKDGAVITYCDGEGCVLSLELARALIGLGYNNVRVLSGGWDAWRQAGLPTEAS